MTLLAIIGLTGCAQPGKRLLDSGSEASQVQLRSIQTRTFDTHDRIQTLRTVMATLQDLSFVIDEADADLGSVSATKLEHFAMRITVIVRPESDTRMLVRANCQFGLTPVHKPEPYQQFFASLEKALFLDRSQVDDTPPVASTGALTGAGRVEAGGPRQGPDKIVDMGQRGSDPEQERGPLGTEAVVSGRMPGAHRGSTQQ